MIEKLDELDYMNKTLVFSKPLKIRIYKKGRHWIIKCKLIDTKIYKFDLIDVYTSFKQIIFDFWENVNRPEEEKEQFNEKYIEVLNRLDSIVKEIL